MSANSDLSLAQIYGSAAMREMHARSLARLERGHALREEMRAQLAAGQTPTGYRAAFLHEVARKVVQLTSAEAARFNDAHPDDMWSVNDLLDVLATCRMQLKSAAGQLVAVEPDRG